MAISAISSWINADGSFMEGLSLLKKYGQISATDLFIYSLPENSVARARLRAQLVAIVDPLITSTARATRSLPVKETPLPVLAPQMSEANNSDITVDMLPPELKPLRIELRRKYSAINYLRGTLSRIPDGMELRRAAEQVLLLDRELTEGWRVLNTWRRTGVVLSAPEANTAVASEVTVQRRNNLRTYISRHTSGKRILPESKLSLYRSELSRLESILHESP